jgi:hypothetical protein
VSGEPDSTGEPHDDIVSDPAAAVTLLHQLKNQGVLPETAERLIVAALSETYTGPLPHPRHLEGYDDVVPGAARDILNMAISEQKHRHRVQMLEIAYPYLGWLAGFVGFLACVAGAIYLGLHQNTPVALALVGVPSVGAIGWFVRARIERTEPD